MEDNNTDSLTFKIVDTNEKTDQDVLAAEDLAWADSCLIEDPEISEANMDSIKEALIHILDQHSEIHNPSAYEQDSNDKTAPAKSNLDTQEVTSHVAEESVDQDLKQENHDVISILKKQHFLQSFHDEMMNMQYPDDDDIAGFMMSEFETEPNDKTALENSDLVTEEASSNAEEKNEEQDLEQEDHDVVSLLKKQPFLPNFHDGMLNFQYSDDDDDVDVAGFMMPEFESESHSDEDIFKVWDLDTAVEEDELGKQLKDALSLNMESIDSLVERIAGLNIK